MFMCVLVCVCVCVKECESVYAFMCVCVKRESVMSGVYLCMYALCIRVCVCVRALVHNVYTYLTVHSLKCSSLRTHSGSVAKGQLDSWKAHVCQRTRDPRSENSQKSACYSICHIQGPQR